MPPTRTGLAVRSRWRSGHLSEPRSDDKNNGSKVGYSRSGQTAAKTGWTTIRSVGDLGSSLRVARKALGLTQADLALAAGVGLRFVVELEAGKPTVRLGLVLRVVDALGVSLQLGDLTTPISHGQ